MGAPASTSAFALAIALWGAVLSTALAGIKIWEVWRDRFQIELDYSFTTSSDHGSHISIHNPSARTLILKHCELLYGDQKASQRRLEHADSGDFDDPPRAIAPYATLDLHFDEERHFSWGADFLNGRRIYLRMHFAGRKPVLQLVYPTDPE